MSLLNWKIPKTWEWVKLKEIGQVVGGGTPSTKQSCYWGEDVSWISPSDLTGYTDKFISQGAKSLTCDGLKNSSAKLMPSGSVHFSTRAPIGYVVISSSEVSTNQGFKSIVPATEMFNEYIYFYLKSIKQSAEAVATGTTFKELSGSAFSELSFPLANLAEQHRIVAKIEQLFSELDKGIESLKAARKQLKVYRQALLKHAFEGKLTEQWRKDDADKLETADQLLARIQQEREVRYQKQLDEWKKAVKRWETDGAEGKKPTKPQVLKEISIIEDSEEQELPRLPKNWGYYRLGEYVVNIEAGKSFKCDEREPNENEVGVAKVSAVTWGEYNESESKTCMDPKKINPDYFINNSDFIFSRANTIELVGACVITKKVTKPIMLSDKTLRINFEAINRNYVLQYLRSWTGRQEIMSRSTGNQDSMRNIGQNRIRAICIPMCSEKEMDKIVYKVDEHLSNIEAQQCIIDESLQKSDALRQSILKKAFSGQLVPQDPNDEAASELLKRIAAEKDEIEVRAKIAKAAAKKPMKKTRAGSR